MGYEGYRSGHFDGREAGCEWSGNAHFSVVPVSAIPKIHGAGQRCGGCQVGDELYLHVALIETKFLGSGRRGFDEVLTGNYLLRNHN